MIGLLRYFTVWNLYLKLSYLVYKMMGKKSLETFILKSLQVEEVTFITEFSIFGENLFLHEARENNCFLSQMEPYKFCIAIPYRTNTGPEQGFSCVVFIEGIPANENRFFLVRKTTQGKPYFHYRDGFAVWAVPYLKVFQMCP